MKFNTFSAVIATAVVSLAAVTHTQASAGHGETAEPAHGEAAGGHGGASGDHGGAGGGHAHDAWPEPPAAFARVSYSGWDDAEAAGRGERIFNRQCAACHGQSGTGDGPVAASLAHPPADLTRHFHEADGEGDGYLFWRVTRGGQAEPFKSAQSAMPAFEDTLTEAQRWDVLSYVHQAFHGGFAEEEGHGGMEAMHGAEASKHGDAMESMHEEMEQEHDEAKEDMHASDRHGHGDEGRGH